MVLLAVTQCRQHVAHAPVVHLFGAGLAAPVRAVGEHDGIDAVDRFGQRLGAGQIALHDVCASSACWQCRSTCGIAHEGTHRVACAQGFVHHQAADAAGGADHQDLQAVDA